MILQTLKKIYPDKSEETLKIMEQDIKKSIERESSASELADFAINLVMSRDIGEKTNQNREDDSTPS